MVRELRKYEVVSVLMTYRRKHTNGTRRCATVEKVMTVPKSKKRDIQAEHEPQFDQEQQEFLRAFEAGDYVDTRPPSPSELAAHQQTARHSRLSRQQKNK